MKTILALCALGCAAMLFSSCGECSCNSINQDYLRDVPVTRSQHFR